MMGHADRPILPALRKAYETTARRLATQGNHVWLAFRYCGGTPIAYDPPWPREADHMAALDGAAAITQETFLWHSTDYRSARGFLDAQTYSLPHAGAPAK
mgnify:CR=1 FL=1